MTDNIFKQVRTELDQVSLFFSSRIFDKDGKDDIDFTEFIIGCYEWQEIPIKNKIEFIFDIFDTETTGFISMADILQVFGTLFINEGIEKNLALERTIEIFSLFTSDIDSKITRDHFVSICMKNEDFIKDIQ